MLLKPKLHGVLEASLSGGIASILFRCENLPVLKIQCCLKLCLEQLYYGCSHPNSN